MARITQGILGGFRGKVGTVVGSSIFGIDVMRAYQPDVHNPQTVSQTIQRNKFSILIPQLRRILSIIHIGFAKAAIKMSAYNAAVKANIVSALEPDGNTWAFMPSGLKTAIGSLVGFSNAADDNSVSGSVTLTWDDNSLVEGANSEDKVYALALNYDTSNIVKSLGVKKRSDGTLTLDISGFEGGSDYDVYLFLVSDTNGSISDSIYFTDTVI